MSKFIDANMNKRAIAVFDFDGTLTSKDTLVEFIKYACGTWRFYLGFTCYSPIIRKNICFLFQRVGVSKI